MMIGISGNNGSTLCAAVLANRHNIVWHTKESIQRSNYIGSMLRPSTVRLGSDPAMGKDIHVPVSDVLPMVHPNDLVLGGWDISGLPMDQAMKRAQVLDYNLQRHVTPFMAKLDKPLPSIYYPDFIAANQEGVVQSMSFLAPTSKLTSSKFVRTFASLRWITVLTASLSSELPTLSVIVTLFLV
jgi:myo-inositol-1-phosphate synthase